MGSLGSSDRVSFMGPRDDILLVLAAIEFQVLASDFKGFDPVIIGAWPLAIRRWPRMPVVRRR